MRDRGQSQCKREQADAEILENHNAFESGMEP